jgi:hypothetical protein
LHSPVTNDSTVREMFQPLGGDALIFRRYTDNWAAPMDHKVNAWDINEQDPGEHGTMGTIPGPVIEANIGRAWRFTSVTPTRANERMAHRE